jgi:hypothetical protein
VCEALYQCENTNEYRFADLQKPIYALPTSALGNMSTNHFITAYPATSCTILHRSRLRMCSRYSRANTWKISSSTGRRAMAAYGAIHLRKLAIHARASHHSAYNEHDTSQLQLVHNCNSFEIEVSNAYLSLADLAERSSHAMSPLLFRRYKRAPHGPPRARNAWRGDKSQKGGMRAVL